MVGGASFRGTTSSSDARRSEREMPMCFEMPWPPSVNGYWTSLRGRLVMSKKGRDYRFTVGAMVECDEPIIGPVAVVICAQPPDRRRRDLDNILKSTLDAIVHVGVLGDDSQIDDLRIYRGSIVPGGNLKVEVHPS